MALKWFFDLNWYQNVYRRKVYVFVFHVFFLVGFLYFFSFILCTLVLLYTFWIYSVPIFLSSIQFSSSNQYGLKSASERKWTRSTAGIIEKKKKKKTGRILQLVGNVEIIRDIHMHLFTRLPASRIRANAVTLSLLFFRYISFSHLVFFAAWRNTFVI